MEEKRADSRSQAGRKLCFCFFSGLSISLVSFFWMVLCLFYLVVDFVFVIVFLLKRSRSSFF